MTQITSDRVSDIVLFLLLLATFLARKLRWKDSTFLFAFAAILAFAAIGKLFLYLGPEPRVPLFLALYTIAALVCLVLGIRDFRLERAALRPFVPDSEVVPNWSNNVPEDDRFSHG